MDRPEDVQADPRTGSVYVVLTNNKDRKTDQTMAANPRADNRFGHIIEMTPPDGDHAAARYRWDILLKCGDPSVAAVGATFNVATSDDGWFGMPDNVAIDGLGRLWIATDRNTRRTTGRTDGIWAMETEGPCEPRAKLFFRCPRARKCAGQPSRRMTRHYSSPSSTRVKATTTIRWSRQRPSRIRRRAGLISSLYTAAAIE